MTNQLITVGTLAELAGVNVETIRFYQRCGYLNKPIKPLGGIRRYGESDVARIRFIKSAQRLGFTLEEISLLLLLEDGTHCEEANEIAKQKLAKVRKKLADLKGIEKALTELVKKCDLSLGSVSCPLVKSIKHAHETIGN